MRQHGRAQLDTPFSQIESNVGTIIKDVHNVISFGVGRSNDERVEHELFDDADAWRESDMGVVRSRCSTRCAVAMAGENDFDPFND